MMMTTTPLSKSCKDKISAQSKIIVGISGGPDSVFLLMQLLNPTLIDLVRPFRPEQIILAHVNFNLRGRASRSDLKFVEQLARKHKIQLEVLEDFPIKQKGNLEEKCREIRYEFFEKLRLEHNAKYILTGHNLNDQIETFFLNFTRGSTLAGFGGMKSYDENRQLIRPLLHLSKVEILEFLKKNRQRYCIDGSNKDLKFSRNRLRHKVIPELEKLNSAFLKTAAQNLFNLGENREIIDEICNKWCEENLKKGKNNSYNFSLDKFLDNSPVLQKKLLSFIYQKTHGKSLTSAQLQEINSTLSKNRSGLRKEFGPQTSIAIVKSPKTQKRQVVINSEFD